MHQSENKLLYKHQFFDSLFFFFNFFFLIYYILGVILWFYTFESFSHQRYLMVLHWRESKFPQVSRTLLSILADLNNAVI